MKKIKLDVGDDTGLFLGNDSALNCIQRSPFSTPVAQITATERLDTVNLNPSLLAIAEQRAFSDSVPERDGGIVQDATQAEPDLLAPETHPPASDDLNGLRKSQQGMQDLPKLANGNQNTVIDETTLADIVMKDFTSLAESTSTHEEPASTSSPDRLPNGTSIGPLIDINNEPKHSDAPHPAASDAPGPDSASVSTRALTEPVAKDVENGIKSREQHQPQQHEPPPPPPPPPPHPPHPPHPPTPTTEKQRRHSSRQSRPVDRFSPVKPAAASPTPGSAVRYKESSAGILNGKSASPDASATGIPKAKQSSPVNQRKSLSIKHVTAPATSKEVKSKVSDETEEEASLRLAIEMQAQEFSLRRRSR